MIDGSNAEEIVRILAKENPDAPPTYLEFSNPFEMLMATILSAHTSDACVNRITRTLFKQYPTPKALASASQEEVIRTIRPCGTYNRKSEYIIRTSKELMDRFDGEVPDTLEDLVTLPGVSRKTANVVLSVVFATNEGVVVDTHVMRVTLKLGLSKHEKKPDKIERDLMETLPQRLWGEYARLVGAHGRQKCKARNPACPSCPLNKLCPSAQL